MTYRRDRRFFLAPLGAAMLLAGASSILAPIHTAAEPDRILVANAATDPLATENTFGTVLSTYVAGEDALVDYASLQADRALLDDYVDALATVDETMYGAWSDEEKIAYWINAYNAITLQAIINEDPIRDSIRDIGGVWRRDRHAVFGGDLTLNNIEHDVLRKDFDEPRIHAALVCAALSCPPLRTEPFRAESLDAQLDDQVKLWLAKEDGFEIDREAGVVRISKIFDWFTGDWVPSYGLAAGDDRFAGSTKERAVLNFISEYVSESDRAYLEAGDYELKYFRYDWSLNSQS